MSISRIEVSIKNKKRFGLVAFLVDRPDFLADIEEARNLLELKSFPYIFPNFPFKEANTVVNYYKKGICRIYDVYSCFKDICKEKNIYLAKLDRTLASAFVLAKSLAKKYHKSGVYIPVMLSSILVGEVKEGDVLPTNTLEIGKQNIDELEERFKGYGKSFEIIVNRESTLKEVKEAFNSVQKYKLGTKKIKNKDKDTFYKIYREELMIDLLPNTRSTIGIVRDWYWRNLDGESALKIAIKDNNGQDYYKEATDGLKHSLKLSDDKTTEYSDYLEYIEQYEDKVEKAIARYKKTLTRHLV